METADEAIDLRSCALRLRLTFTTGLGYHVTLDSEGASFHVGATAASISIRSQALVDFPLSGQGTANEAVTGEVWLTGGDINAADDQTPNFEFVSPP